MSRASDDDRRALSQYLREIRGFPLLTREDEHRLLREIEGGNPDAATRLVECNLSFVVKVAAEYRSLGVPFEDLLNEGNLGLIEAAKRFDLSKGTKFITYAIWWIRRMILKAIADRSLLVRMSSYQRKRIFALRKAEAALLNRLGRTPTREEIAGYMSISVAQVDSLRHLHLAHVSLDRGVGDDETVPLSSFLTDPGKSSEERLLGKEAEFLVARAFRRLTPREQAVLGWRLALGGQSPLTLQQIGKRLGLSRERVRQIETVAKQRLRRLVAASRRVSAKVKTRQATFGRRRPQVGE